MDLKFKEPHISGGVAIITISEEKAIDFTKKCSTIAMTDDAALKHFVLMNQAYYDEGDVIHKVHG